MASYPFFRNKADYFNFGLIIVVITTIAFVAFDFLTAKPTHQQGKVIEKIFVPAHTVSGNQFSGMPKTSYKIATATEEQWIAIVKTGSGDTLKVHCHLSHYQNTNVGDLIRFSKYDGHLFHIDYLAHNEEE